MKKLSILSLLISLSTTFALSQSKYDDYTEEQREYIVNDEFNDNTNNWNVRDNDAEKSLTARNQTIKVGQRPTLAEQKLHPSRIFL